MNRANETMGQGTWFWNNTDYLNYVNETESFVTQERTNQSHYSREYGVVVNDTIVLDVIVDVKDHWTVEHGFSYLDLNTGVRDYMSVETEAHQVNGTTEYVQKIAWNGVLQDTLYVTSNSSDIDIDYVSPDGQYNYTHYVWAKDMQWQAVMSKNNDTTGYPDLFLSFYLYDGWTSC